VVVKTGLEQQTITADANYLFIFVLPLGSERKLWMHGEWIRYIVQMTRFRKQIRCKHPGIS
jgi:hypothetical protein